MAAALYKPGQGYWVRVLSATMAGIVILAASGWLWNQLEAASDRIIPTAAWQLTLAAIDGQAQPGQTVQLHGESAVPGQPGPQLGTAVVRTSDPTSGGGDRLVIEPPTFTGAADVGMVRSILPQAGSGATLAGQVVAAPQPIKAFDSLYLVAGGVGALMLIGAVITYYLVGIRQGSVEFLIATDGEMKKVNWSTRKNIIDSTTVVIVWSLLLAVGLFGVDYLFAQFFKLIGVLQH